LSGNATLSEETGIASNDMGMNSVVHRWVISYMKTESGPFGLDKCTREPIFWERG
jgi:hypothetical protein